MPGIRMPGMSPGIQLLLLNLQPMRRIPPPLPLLKMTWKQCWMLQELVWRTCSWLLRIHWHLPILRRLCFFQARALLLLRQQFRALRLLRVWFRLVFRAQPGRNLSRPPQAPSVCTGSLSCCARSRSLGTAQQKEEQGADSTLGQDKQQVFE